MGTQMTRCAVLIGAVPLENLDFLKPYLPSNPLIICADGGLNNAQRAQLVPDYLVGDWDSGGKPIEGIPAIGLPAEKNVTDLQAAAELAMTKGYQDLVICGATGGRLDHTVANLLLLEWIFEQGGNGMILDPENEVRFLDRATIKLSNHPAYRYVSLLPLDQKVEGVTLQGLKYPLQDAVLTRGETLSISNEFQSDTAAISVRSGRILIIRSGID